MTGILAFLVGHPVLLLLAVLTATLGIEVVRRRRVQAKLRAAHQEAITKEIEAGEAARKAERGLAGAQMAEAGSQVKAAEKTAQEATAAAASKSATTSSIFGKWNKRRRAGRNPLK